jgi:hypothetical protein
MESDILAYGLDKTAPYKFVKGADAPMLNQGQGRFFIVDKVNR